MSDIVELTTTVETKEQAQELAQRLVKDRLAACVQISGPVTSVYRWQGKICESEEYRCTIKSTLKRSAAVFGAIHNLHPYDVPEVLMVEVVRGSEGYVNWVAAQVDPKANDDGNPA